MVMVMEEVACCIGTSNGPKNEPPRQRSHPLVSHLACRMASITASALEDAVYSRLSHSDAIPDDGSDAGDAEPRGPVRIFASDDAAFLRCRPLLAEDDIFGIEEHTASRTTVSLCAPRLDPVDADGRGRARAARECACHHPRRSWVRRKRQCHATSTSPGGAHVHVVDLTEIQRARRDGGPEGPFACFDTPGRVFHLLRSLLAGGPAAGGRREASPWHQAHGNDDVQHRDRAPDAAERSADHVVALLVTDPDTQDYGKGNEADSFWAEVERREVDELLHFRTGDAAPGHFLHSTARLRGGSQFVLDLVGRADAGEEVARASSNENGTSSSTLMLVYRPLPPRDDLSPCASRDEDAGQYAGCLRETYLAPAGPDAGPASRPPIARHRPVAPPYQSHAQEYPGLLDAVLRRLDAVREEARRIPRWTAWPEQNHYADDAAWTVFPLCYTFPGHDVTRRTWLEKTCVWVPDTTRLLRGLGPALRTALFSRLGPRTGLGTHTGWADLANHVLRVRLYEQALAFI